MTSTSVYINVQEQEEHHNNLIFLALTHHSYSSGTFSSMISSPLPQLLFNSSEHQFCYSPSLYVNTGILWVSYITQVCRDHGVNSFSTIGKLASNNLQWLALLSVLHLNLPWVRNNYSSLLSSSNCDWVLITQAVSAFHHLDVCGA